MPIISIIGVIILAAASIASLVCWIIVLIRVFPKNLVLGIVSIIPLVGFIVGWVMSTTCQLRKVMTVWTVAIVLSFGMNIVILVPALEAARANPNKMKSSTMTRSIGQALIMYASSNREVYPPDLATLVQSGTISVELIVSPFSTATVPSDFDQWPADQQSSWIKQNGSLVYRGNQHVMLHGKPEHYEGGIPVGYRNGSSEWLDEDEAQALLSELAAKGPASP